MNTPRLVLLGCSAGGMQALRAVVAGLGASVPFPLVAVCHTGSEDVGAMCALLATEGLPVREAREREHPRAGVMHVAPSGYHLLIERDGRFALSVDDRVAYSRPSIDVLFESAVDAHGGRLVGVVMTGANADGADGLAAVRAAGGIAVVQCPDDAEAPEMPSAAIERAGADHCVPLARIPALLLRLA